MSALIATAAPTAATSSGANTRSIGWPIDDAEQDEHRADEQRDLEARPEAHGHRELHLVLQRELDRDEVLGEVADRRDEDHADEELRQPERLDEPARSRRRGSPRAPRAGRPPPSSTTDRRAAGPRRRRRGRSARLVAAERRRRVRELEDERERVADHQQQRDEHRLLDEAALRRLGGRRGEHRRDEQPDRGEHEERGVRAGDLLAEPLARRSCSPPTQRRSRRGRAAGCR